MTVGGQTRRLGEPFFVLGHAKPHRAGGHLPAARGPARPLPAARQGRLPRPRAGAANPRTHHRRPRSRRPGRCLTAQDVLSAQRIAREVPVPRHVVDFVLDLIRKSRPRTPEAPAFVSDFVEWGPGPRAGQALLLTAKVRALLQGRYHVTDRRRGGDGRPGPAPPPRPHLQRRERGRRRRRPDRPPPRRRPCQANRQRLLTPSNLGARRDDADHQTSPRIRQRAAIDHDAPRRHPPRA